MVRMSEFAADDGLALANRIARRDVSPLELTDAVLSAIEEIDPSINAIGATNRALARQSVSEGVPAGPFAGVPFLIKEVILHAPGFPCRGGSRLSGDAVETTETELMTRFRRAGFVTVGTTHTPEWGYSATTESVRFGPTRNPWNLQHSSGGSSGGASAAVAAGIVPIAHANDGGGSIRIPAACCGLFGLKPSRMRTPPGPDTGEPPIMGLAVEFAVTRSVRDAAALLDAVAGPEVGAPYWPPQQAMPFSESIARPRKGLRIAVSTRAPNGLPVHPDCIDAVHDVARLCESLGHELVEHDPKLDWEPYLEALLRAFDVYLAVGMEHVSRVTGRRIGPDTVEASSLAAYEAGKRASALELMASLEVFNRVTRSYAAFFSGIDVLLTPVLSRPPAQIGELDQNAPVRDATEWGRRIFDYAHFTTMMNVTGMPAMSVPLVWNDAGLPIGVQFAASYGAEATLLNLASQLEAARPWINRRPPVYV